MSLETCPDGFQLAADHPLYEAHRLLNQYLAGRTSPAGAAEEAAVDWKAIPPRRRIEVLRAALDRLDWQAQNRQLLPDAEAAMFELSRIVFPLVGQRLAFNAEDLSRILRTVAAVGEEFRPPLPQICRQVERHLRSQPMTAELSAALRRFHDGLTGGPSALAVRERVGLILWRSEFEPVRDDECWSAVVRADLRAMEGERKAAWRNLFAFVKAEASSQPGSKWAEEAGSRLGAVGRDEFCARVLAWFAPFRSGEKLPLSPPGVHVLKHLVWYCGLVRDEQVDQAALSLLDAGWKQPQRAERVMGSLAYLLSRMPAETAWEPLVRLYHLWGRRDGAIGRTLFQVAARMGISKQELARWGLHKPPGSGAGEAEGPPLSAQEALHYLPHGDRMKWDGEFLVVQGDVDCYRIHISTRVIRRESDGAYLELDLNQVPENIRPLVGAGFATDFGTMTMQAALLAEDSIHGGWFVRKQTN